MKARYVSNLTLVSALLLAPAISQAVTSTFDGSVKSGAVISQPTVTVEQNRYYATGFKSGNVAQFVTDANANRFFATGSKSGAVVSQLTMTEGNRYYNTSGFKSGAVAGLSSVDNSRDRYYDIPETGTLALFGTGLILISLLGRRHRH